VKEVYSAFPVFGTTEITPFNGGIFIFRVIEEVRFS